jgi:hypothetical protein
LFQFEFFDAGFVYLMFFFGDEEAEAVWLAHIYFYSDHIVSFTCFLNSLINVLNK